MTAEEGIDFIDRLVALRRELTAIARGIQPETATFILEWRDALPALAERLATLAALEAQLEPVLAPADGERWTLRELRSWLQQWTQVADEDARTLPVLRAPRALHPVVH